MHRDQLELELWALRALQGLRAQQARELRVCKVKRALTEPKVPRALLLKVPRVPGFKETQVYRA